MPKNTTPETPAETPAKVAFTVKPVTALPKREAPKNEPDMESARALLALLSETVDDGEGLQVTATASDGVVSTEQKDARLSANKAKRLLSHVLPDGKAIVTRVYKSGDGFEWAIWITDAKAEAPAAASA